MSDSLEAAAAQGSRHAREVDVDVGISCFSDDKACFLVMEGGCLGQMAFVLSDQRKRNFEHESGGRSCCTFHNIAGKS